MITAYEYIGFRKDAELSAGKKTGVWRCYAGKTGDELGMVRWFGRWRQYCFLPNGDTVYSRGCLDDIKSFIQQLMDMRRKT